MISPFISTLFSVASGIPVTLTYSLVPLFFGFILGTVLGLIKVSGPQPTRWLVNLYVSIFRGTPLLVQLMIVAYGFPGILGIKISAFAAGLIAFSCNSAAYVCEIVRAGIESVDNGQYEAASALSIPYWMSMKDIILPQAFKRVLPALVSEAINLVKESAIISMLPGIADITRQAQIISMQNYSFFEPMLAAACCYYVITSVLNLIGHALEVKLQQGAKS